MPAQCGHPSNNTPRKVQGVEICYSFHGHYKHTELHFVKLDQMR